VREPTPDSVVFAWWWASLAGERPGVHEDEPQCGLFKRRIQARGPFVPARIYLDREVDEETGELLSDEVLRCEVNGTPRDPHQEWLWLAKYPVSVEEHEEITITAKGMIYEGV